MIRNCTNGLGWGMFILGAVLAAGFVVGAQALGTGIARINKQPASISVRGTAHRDVVSDQGSWSAVTIARAKTLPEAFAVLQRSTDAVKALIATTPLAGDSMQVSEIDTDIVYEQNSKGVTTTTIESYVLRQTIWVWSSKVKALADIAVRATDLIKDGIEIRCNSPRFRVSSLEQVKLELLEQATKNAAQRAALLAAGSSNSVGTLLSASQGVFQIVRAGSTDVSDSGYSDESAIDKTARATVSLEYAIGD